LLQQVRLFQYIIVTFLNFIFVSFLDKEDSISGLDLKFGFRTAR